MPRRLLPLHSIALLLGALLWAAAAHAEKTHVIGVLAVRPKPQTEAAHAQLADYLSDSVPGHRFTIRAYFRNELRDAAHRRAFDFVIANPDLYVELEARHGASRIATQVAGKPGRTFAELAGLIFARADRTDLNALADLKGRRIAAVAPDAFGGYLIHGAALQEAGIDPRTDIIVDFIGLPQDKIVKAVLDGRADAGFIRSGVIEAMAAEGKIRQADLKPLAPRNGRLPLWHTTRAYPEWAFAVMPNVPEDLGKRIAIALLSLPAGHPAASDAKYAGWGVPASYEPVHDVLKEMRAPPYDAPVAFDLKDVLRQYAFQVITVLLVVTGLIAVFALRNVWLHRQLMREQAKLRLSDAVFENALAGLVVTDSAGTVVAVNPAFSRVTGYTRDEIVGQNPRLLKSGRHEDDFYTALWRDVLEKGQWRGEIWNRRKDGTVYPEILNISSVRDANGQAIQFVGSFNDISELKAAEENLRRLAHFDALTGLPNRSLLMDRIEQAMKQTLRRERLLAVCFLDLDGFKPVNDTWGHETGDRLLVEVAQRLQAALRAGDTVARLGGDEFVLLLPDLATVDELTLALDRVLASLAMPYPDAGGTIRIGGSIGATLYPFDDTTADGLLRHADHAMYRAKQQGRGKHMLFDPVEMSDRAA